MNLNPNQNPNLDWHYFGLSLALDHAKMSKDPSTKVGAVILGQDFETLCGGFNGLPRGICDTELRLNNRELKYKLIVHAEENSLLTAARQGIKIKDCTLYYAAIDSEGNLVWGGAPCIRCTSSLIQAGITKVVTFQAKILDRWAEDMKLASDLLYEAKVEELTLVPRPCDISHAKNLFPPRQLILETSNV